MFKRYLTKIRNRWQAFHASGEKWLKINYSRFNFYELIAKVSTLIKNKIASEELTSLVQQMIKRKIILSHMKVRGNFSAQTFFAIAEV